MKVIEQTPTITAGAYSALDAVGGLLEFEDACTPYSNSGKIAQAILLDDAKQAALLYLVLFDRTFTATADNAAFAVSDADLQNVIGVVEFAVADYVSINANCYAEKLDFTELPFVLIEGGTSLFGQLFVKTSTPTYVATDDIVVKLIIK